MRPAFSTSLICPFLSCVQEQTAPRQLSVHAEVLFHQHSNGRVIADREGAILRDADEACACAVQGTPARLRRAIRQEATNYLATEISDGERTLYVIRGKIIVEKR
jgi:hypothetical protein